MATIDQGDVNLQFFEKQQRQTGFRTFDENVERFGADFLGAAKIVDPFKDCLIQRDANEIGGVRQQEKYRGVPAPVSTMTGFFMVWSKL